MTDNAWLLHDDTKGQDAVDTAAFVRSVVEENEKKQLAQDISGDEGVKTVFGSLVDLHTMDRLQALNDKSERALTYFVSKVAVDGKYMYAPGEPETIGEWLANAMDEAKGGEFSDLKFIAEILVPFMTQNNIPNAAFLWAAGTKKKARTAVPYLRLLFKKGEPDIVERIKEVVEWVTDPEVGKFDIEAKLKELRGVEPPVPCRAVETIKPGGKTTLLIEADTEEQYSVIKKRLKGLIEIKGDSKKVGARQGALI